MSKTPFITHTSCIGAEITFQIRKLFGLQFLNIHVNFDPIQHILFASAYIMSIPGVKRITSVTIDDKHTGTYFFSLENDFDSETIIKGIENEFNQYSKILKQIKPV